MMMMMMMMTIMMLMLICDDLMCTEELDTRWLHTVPELKPTYPRKLKKQLESVVLFPVGER